MRQCPVDDFTLKAETYEGVEIDTCPHCSGVWLDAGELEVLQNTQDSDFRGVPSVASDDVVAAEAMSRARTEAPRICVVCDDVMAKKEYAFSSQVMVDQCPRGHGIWLDRHELSRLEKFFEDESDLADLMASMEAENKGLGALLTRIWGRLRD